MSGAGDEQLSKWPIRSRNYHITNESIPIILEAFKHGTEFQVTTPCWEGTMIGLLFEGKLIKIGGMCHIKVSNDERRRMIVVIKDFLERKIYLSLQSQFSIPNQIRM